MSIKLQLPKLTDLKPRITVVGVGGAGGNAINNMIASGLDGVDFIVANTDAQALLASSAEHRIQLGVHVTEGLGAGSKPEVGEAAAEEAIEEIRSQVAGSHMVFIAAGMGGGTGTGAAAVIARIAQSEGVLTVGIVTKPFQFEGTRRMRIAEAGIDELKKHVDTLIVIPNQNLFRIANEKTTFAEAFVLADQVLYSGIACIVDLIVKEGLINLDFADVRTVLAGMGTAMMGTGESTGDRRALEAAEEAIANPLLDEISLRGAKGLLISIIGGREMTLYEVDEAASRIRQEVDTEANIIVGATFDDSLGDKVRVSIVASGMERQAARGGSSGRETTSDTPSQSSSSHSSAAPAIEIEEAAQPPVPAPAPEPMPESPAQPATATQTPLPPPTPEPEAQSQGGSTDDARGDAEMDEDELQRRLSVALQDDDFDTAMDEDEDEQRSAYQTDGDGGIAGEPWHAPGDVTIEEGPPQLTPAPAPGRAGPAPAHAELPRFQPAAPNEIRRPGVRMPDIEDFPAIGQREYKAKTEPSEPDQQPRRPASGAPDDGPEGKRRSSLFARLTGRSRKAGDSHAGQDAAGPQGTKNAGGASNAPARQDFENSAPRPSIGPPRSGATARR